MAARILQANINTRCPGHAMASDAKVQQAANDGLFHPVYIFFDKVACAMQVHQWVGHHLAWPMEGDLAPPVGGNDRDVTGRQQVTGLSCKPLGERAGVLANPKLVWGIRCACRSEVLHGLVGGCIRQQTLDVNVHTSEQVVIQRTILTMGWVDSVR